MGWMIVRLILSLAFVAVVLFFAARLAKSRGLGRGAALIEVLGRQPMGRTSSVNLIRVADRVFLVGSTEAQITLIGELDDTAVNEAIAAATVVPEAASAPVRAAVPATVPSGALAGSVFDRSQWATFINSLRDKTVRRS